jgi:predicted transcriptional regulator
MSMQVFSARVQNGAIVPDDGIELAEGSRVTVIAREAGAPSELSAEDEAELAESMAEADRGEVVSAEELFRRLSR